MGQKAELTTVAGQPSWRLRSDAVKLYVTQRGGHLAPVTFDRRGQEIEPFAIAPWAEEKLDRDMPDILKVLRGDFFCLPFGANAKAYRGEEHTIHGETANRKWKLVTQREELGECILHLRLKTKVRAGQVDKYIRLRQGHQAVYCQHVIGGMGGKMNFGHHACLKFPDRPGSGLLSTSKRLFGQVNPVAPEDPAAKGYSLLQPGAEFEDLAKVPTITGETADLSSYPARRGFEDLALLVNDPAGGLAWAAASFPKERYVWFSLKDPRILPATLLWHSNGGRHYPPWNGRHVNVLGVEDIVGCFADGLAASAGKNALAKRGITTCHTLSETIPLTVNYIMACVPTPKGFDRVVEIRPLDDESVELESESGMRLSLPLRHQFLQAGPGEG